MPRWTVGTGGSMAVGLQARRRQSLLGVLLLGVALVGLGTWSSFARADGGPGSVLAWGDNGDGELGNGTVTASSVPVAVSAPPGTTFVQIAAEDDGSLALSSTGQVYAWGYNGQGELGDGSTTNSDTPVAVSAGAIPGGATITQIAGGGRHSLALSSTGQLYTWGLNVYGQLGDGTTTNSDVPVAVSAGAIPAGATITQIAAGAFHSLALSSTGQLYTWGLNEYGQLGDGSTTNSSVPVAVSAGAIPAGATITQIAGGEYHSLALSSTGQLYAWGKNANGELGDGTNSNSSVPAATSLPAGTTIDALARGSFAEHALAIIGDLSITT